MRPCPPRAAAALLAALAFTGPAAAQFGGHTVVVEPLTLRIQSGPTTFTAGSFFMGLAVNGTEPAPPTPYTFATVTKPDLSTVSLGQYSTNLFVSETQFSTLTALRTAFPGGTYGAAIGPNGPALPTVTLPADYVPPVFPEFTNHTAAQAINPQQAFTFTFTAFGGSELTNTIALGVTDIGTNTVVYTSQFGPAETQHTLPAGTLTAGRSYAVSLYFIELQDFNFAVDGSVIHVAQSNLASANVMSLTPVPEPAAGLAVVAAVLGGFAARRKKNPRPLFGPPRDES